VYCISVTQLNLGGHILAKAQIVENMNSVAEQYRI